MKILYSNAPAGSGKTFSALNTVIENAKQGFATLIAMPTLKLINETTSKHPGLQACSINTFDPDPDAISVKVITSETVGQTRNVSDVLREELRQRKYKIIFTTHAALLGNPDLPVKGSWNLIVDEVFDVFQIVPLAVNESHDEVMKGISVVDWEHSDSYEFIADPSDPHFIRRERLEKVETDELFKVLEPFHKAILDPHTNVLMSKSSYRDMAYKDYKRLDLGFMKNPSILGGWLRVTLMGANFDNSFLYHYWRKLGVEFIKDEQINLRHELHSYFQGGRLTVKYLLEDENRIWTKGLIRGVGFDHITGKLERHLTKKFIYTMNNSNPVKKENYDWKPESGQYLPVKAQGLNDYQSFCCAVFLAALNYDDSSLNTIAHLMGLNKQDINRANAHETVYQFIMRTNMRDTTSEKPVEAIVGDKATADYITGILENSKSEWLDIGIEAFKFRQVEEKSKPSLAHDSTSRSIKSRQKAIETRNQLEALSELAVGLTGFESVESKTGYFGEVQSMDQLDKTLREFYESNVSGKKHENILFSGAMFSSVDGVSSGRTEADFLAIGIMQLDFDNTDLAPERCSNMLGEFEHWIFNSSSNFNATGSLRYRVLIPFTANVTKAFYEQLWDMFEARFIQAGFDDKTKRLGLDRSKRNPVMMFYAPCVAAKGTKHSFFNRNANPNKKVLNPADFIKQFSLPDHEIVRVKREDRRGDLVIKMAEAVQAKPASKAPIGDLFAKYERRWVAAEKGTAKIALSNIQKMMREDGVTRNEAQQWFDMYAGSRAEQGQAEKHARDWAELVKTM